MSERRESGFGEFTQEAVVEAHDAHIFRHILSCACKFFDEPVGNFIILTNDGRAGTEILADKIREKPGCLLFLQCEKFC